MNSLITKFESTSIRLMKKRESIFNSKTHARNWSSTKSLKAVKEGMYFLLLYKVFSRSKKKFQIHEKTFLVQVRVRSAVENIKGTEYAAKVSCVPIAIVVRDAR